MLFEELEHIGLNSHLSGVCISFVQAKEEPSAVAGGRHIVRVEFAGQAFDLADKAEVRQQIARGEVVLGFHENHDSAIGVLRCVPTKRILSTGTSPSGHLQCHTHLQLCDHAARNAATLTRSYSPCPIAGPRTL